MDEVGRGAWAGPFVACALLAGRGEAAVRGVRDSKRLTPAERQRISVALKEHHQFAIGIVTVDELNTIGLGRAQVLVFERAINQPWRHSEQREESQTITEILLPDQMSGLRMTTCPILIDGRPMRTHPEWRAVIDGDDKEYAIAAASIIAKVARDKMMEELHAADDRYRFDLHKGYGTSLHQQLLAEHGPSTHHRRLFEPIRKMLYS